MAVISNKQQKKEKVLTLAKLFLECVIGESLTKIPIKINKKDFDIFNGVDSPFLYREDGTLIVKSAFFDETKKVKDKHRYNLKHEDGGWKLTKPCGEPVSANISECDVDIVAVANEGDNNIVILLESPHNDEYDDSFNPKSPACGTTGENFYKCFVNQILPVLIVRYNLILCTQKIYRIYLVNPVPYQASLFHIHGKLSESDFTKKIWRKLFNHSCKKDFESRLKSYRPSIIINSCTSGLNDRIKTSINGLYNKNSGVMIFNTLHPSAWIELVKG